MGGNKKPSRKAGLGDGFTAAVQAVLLRWRSETKLGFAAKPDGLCWAGVRSAFARRYTEHRDRVGVARLDQGKGLLLLAHLGECRGYCLWRERAVAGATAILLLGHRDAAPSDRQRRQRGASDVVDPLRQPIKQR